STQVRLEYKGEAWVISGDYKVFKDGVSTPFESVKCNSFITESTFGLPKLLHFRKHGLFIPTPTLNPDLKRMITLIHSLNPLEVVFLGDLFHSDQNSEYDSFISSINLYPNIQFTLTKGNHEIIPEKVF